MNLRPFTLHVALLLPFALITGCGASDGADDESDDTVAVTSMTLQAQGDVSLFDETSEAEGLGVDELASAEDSARSFAERPSRELLPDGCARKVRSGSVVTITATRCTGRLGRRELSGTMTATFSKPSSDVLHVALATDQMTANGHAYALAAEVDIRSDGQKRTVTYHGQSSGKTARGRDYSRTSELTLVRDTSSACTALDGTSRGTIGRYDVDVEIAGFQRCGEACPTSGSARATVDGPLVKDATMTVSFDGSDQARLVVDARKQRTSLVTLDCQMAEATDSREVETTTP